MKDEGYIIKGGEEGKSRLNILSEILFPYTKSLLEAQGVGKGKSFLDVGCGGGNVAALAAEMVGNDGSVVGIDYDNEIIRLARSDANTTGNNVTYEVLSACEMSYDKQFDVAYARFLLFHLKNPLDVLIKMAQSVKSGGKVIVEDTHFSGHLCYPECEAFDSYVTLFMRAGFNNGHNPEIGPSLYSLFMNAGLKEIGFDIIFPCFNTGIGKWMAHITLDRIKSTLIKQGLAQKEQIDAMLAELETFIKDEKTIISMPHIFRVWGQKE